MLGEFTQKLILRPARVLRGRVTDAATGGPVAGARVGMNWTLERAVTTKDDGSYELPGSLINLLIAQTRIASGERVGNSIVLANEQRLQCRQLDILIGAHVTGQE